MTGTMKVRARGERGNVRNNGICGQNEHTERLVVDNEVTYSMKRRREREDKEEKSNVCP